MNEVTLENTVICCECQKPFELIDLTKQAKAGGVFWCGCTPEQGEDVDWVAFDQVLFSAKKAPRGQR